MKARIEKNLNEFYSGISVELYRDAIQVYAVRAAVLPGLDATIDNVKYFIEQAIKGTEYQIVNSGNNGMIFHIVPKLAVSHVAPDANRKHR